MLRSVFCKLKRGRAGETANALKCIRSVKWPALGCVGINGVVLSCEAFCVFGKAAVAVG